MANLSSETLFHFTSSLDTLKNILFGGLRYGMFSEKLPFKNHAYFVRGISFCNIPLSMIAEHTDWYGRYAIGIKRSSLRDFGASPVFYIHSKTKSLPKGKGTVTKLTANPLLGYFKQHYGKQYHKVQSKYIFKHFYDEKEWRLFSGTPEIRKYSALEHLEDLRRYKDTTVPEIDPLRIKTDRIEYIILEKPTDFLDFDAFLRTNYPGDREKFLTKILYYTQIKKDF